VRAGLSAPAGKRLSSHRSAPGAERSEFAIDSISREVAFETGKSVELMIGFLRFNVVGNTSC